MTNLINQISINGKTHTFLNYVNPVIGAESFFPNSSNSSTWNTFMSTAFPTGKYSFSGNGFFFTPPNDPYLAGTTTRYRYYIMDTTYFDSGVSNQYINATTSTTVSYNIAPSGAPNYGFVTGGNYAFMVGGPDSLSYVSFTSTARSTVALWLYLGLARNGQYTGGQAVRNFIYAASLYGADPFIYRPGVENTTTFQRVSAGSPSLSCSISTPGANASEIILRDDTSPYNYIGQLWNMIRLPSSCIFGKIYKNTGIDPDTGSVETDQKAFWMCIGSWGSDKIGMRVWTENIT